MADCVFCKIIKGEIPSTKIYEDKHTLAILDINPLTPGHTLLMTKEHYPTLLETPPETLQQLMEAAYPVVRALVAGLKAGGYNLLLNNNRCAGQIIPHLHWHIIPRRENDEVSFHWHHRPYQPGEMEAVARNIRAQL